MGKTLISSPGVCAKAWCRGNGGASAHAVRRSDIAAMLTTREQEVIALIAEGYPTREMAELLSVSTKTYARLRQLLMWDAAHPTATN